MLRNLASSLFLTERDAEDDDNQPKVKGRVVTTLQKAKEVRSLVERCITIAKRSLPAEEAASQYETDADRNTEAWIAWRRSEQWQHWNAAIAPVVAARRRTLRLLGSKEAVSILFDEVAPRFADREGGYTRVLRLAKPRLGDAGTRAIIEFVGIRDRVAEHAPAPMFEDENSPSEAASSQESMENPPESEQAAVVDEAASTEQEDGDAKEGSEEEKK